MDGWLDLVSMVGVCVCVCVTQCIFCIHRCRIFIRVCVGCNTIERVEEVKLVVWFVYYRKWNQTKMLSTNYRWSSIKLRQTIFLEMIEVMQMPGNLISERIKLVNMLKMLIQIHHSMESELIFILGNKISCKVKFYIAKNVPISAQTNFDFH